MFMKLLREIVIKNNNGLIRSTIRKDDSGMYTGNIPSGKHPFDR